jgi:hypothetical protein
MTNSTFFRGSFNFKSFKEANQLPSLSDVIFARMRARFLLAEFPTKYQPKPGYCKLDLESSKYDIIIKEL